jgi:hypothetical protein
MASPRRKNSRFKTRNGRRYRDRYRSRELRHQVGAKFETDTCPGARERAACANALANIVIMPPGVDSSNWLFSRPGWPVNRRHNDSGVSDKSVDVGY